MVVREKRRCGNAEMEMSIQRGAFLKLHLSRKRILNLSTACAGSVSELSLLRHSTFLTTSTEDEISDGSREETDVDEDGRTLVGPSAILAS